MYEAGHGASSHGISTLEAMLGRTEYEKTVADFDSFVSQQLEGAPLLREDPDLQRYVTYSHLTLDDVADIADATDSPRMRELLKAADAVQAQYRKQHEGTLQPLETFDGSTHVLVELYEYMTTQNGQVQQKEKGATIQCIMNGVCPRGYGNEKFVHQVDLGGAQYVINPDGLAVRYTQQTQTKPSKDLGKYAQVEDLDIIKRLVERSKKNAAPTMLDVVRGGIKRVMNIFSRP
ncbi:MAG: hypothetical protein D8B38_05675 [Candidatus Saccharimonas sp.]|nr:MAG: hypothetical protein D8B38_05675 [Candidatus Saccharimonas sp.]